ncbi:GNAT family N-acetyltransferase [Pelagibius marinus]|uniref:GNAT family N-acetyltransferase n=1 Tax=Pelagibius marinus TaxID=2762760 RepID=UPI001872F46D|nr:GNAT family N-acetyltransferase [Pelagibius marinus]
MQNQTALGAQCAAPRRATADAGHEPSRREVELKFWFGPFRLWTAVFDMQVEHWSGDPLGQTVPDPAALPEGVDGLYRPSQIVRGEEPDLRFSSTTVRYIESRFRRRFIDLTTGFDNYMSKFSGKTRSTFRRKFRKFREASAGTIDWRVYRSAREMEEFHLTARQVSRRTYQEKLFDAGLPDDADFVAGMLARAESGQVRGFILFLGGEPISYLYLPIVDGRVIYGRLGFDPAYAVLSPGTILQLLALESLFAEQCHRIFDFTEGEGEHKRLFATQEVLCGNVYYLRATTRHRTLVRLHCGTRRLADLVDRQLSRVKLKTHLKHILRGQYRAPQERGRKSLPKR